MLFREAEGDVVGNDKRESSRNPAQPETPGMPGNSRRENREPPRVSGSQRPDRLEKATSYKEGQRVRQRGGYLWLRQPARAVAWPRGGYLWLRQPARAVALPRGVGRTGSTCEVSQPGCVRPAEGMEGSRSTQGNTEENRTLRAQDRKGVSQGTSTGAGSSPQGPEAEVHRTATPCDDRPAAGQLLLVEEGGCARSGRNDVGAIGRGSGGAVAGPTRTNPSRRIPRPTVEKVVHRQGGWSETATGDCGAGGQNRSTGGGHGSPSDLRRELPGILLWVPAGT